MKSTNSTAIGLFIVGGVMVFVAAILLFSSGVFFGKSHNFVLYFKESVNGLDVGAPVKLHGVRIGQVRQVFVQFDSESREVRVPVIITLEDSFLRNGRRSRLFTVSPSIDSYVKKVDESGREPDLAHSPLILGLMGVLQMESLVTGKLFVELNYAPADAKHYLAVDSLGYSEIPTKESDLQNLGDRLMKVAEGLSSIDYGALGNSIGDAFDSLAKVNFAELTASINHAADAVSGFLEGDGVRWAIHQFGLGCMDFRSFLDGVNQSINPLMSHLQAASQQFGWAMEQFGSVFNPTSSIFTNLNGFLQESKGAAISLRLFLDFLERNPDALLNGKYVGK